MAGKKIHDSETKIHLIQCAKKEFMEKSYEGLFTPYFDYSRKNIDREVKFK